MRTSFNRQRPELQPRVSEVDQETSGHALFGKAREEDRDLEEAAKKLFNLGKDLLDQEEEQEAELTVRVRMRERHDEVQHTARMVREINVCRYIWKKYTICKLDKFSSTLTQFSKSALLSSNLNEHH